MNHVTDIRTRAPFDGQRDRRTGFTQSTFDLPEPQHDLGMVWDPKEMPEDIRIDAAFILGGLIVALAIMAIALIAHFAPQIEFWAGQTFGGMR